MMVAGCGMEWERWLDEICNLFNNSGKICSIIEMWETGRWEDDGGDSFDFEMICSLDGFGLLGWYNISI